MSTLAIIGSSPSSFRISGPAFRHDRATPPGRTSFLFRESVAEATATAGSTFRLRATDVTRLEAFSDPVFALALLAVSLSLRCLRGWQAVPLSGYPYGMSGPLEGWHRRRDRRSQNSG